MLVHAGLFKFKEGTDPEEIERIFAKIRAVKDQVDGVLESLAGENFSERANGWTHGLVFIFESKEAMEEYRHHPLHDVAMEGLAELIESALNLDVV